jgi:hypothetical protein
MPSQKLRLDDLVVESFHTTAARGFNGTVQGYVGEEDGSILSLCGDSCGGTCPPKHTCVMDTTCAPEHTCVMDTTCEPEYTCKASCRPCVPDADAYKW